MRISLSASDWLIAVQLEINLHDKLFVGAVNIAGARTCVELYNTSDYGFTD